MGTGYDWLGLYYDADDPRVIVPKRIAWMGWTINVGHRRGQAALVGSLIATAALIALVG